MGCPHYKSMKIHGYDSTTARQHESTLMPRLLHSVLVVITVLWLSCLSQDLLLGAVTQGPDRKIARAVRVDGSPILDGDLNEAFWNAAPSVSEFLQRDPREGEPATERTEVKIIYNDQSIFFGVLCEDSEAGRIIANERARDDQLESDDTFEIILDTFHNYQDGFLFRTNPLGKLSEAALRPPGVWRSSCRTA